MLEFVVIEISLSSAEPPARIRADAGEYSRLLYIVKHFFLRIFPAAFRVAGRLPALRRELCRAGARGDTGRASPRLGRGDATPLMRPTVIAVGGFNSNTGKTTLVCELLRALPGWEALKMTRGHYRSCGRDPRACCVSPLLGAEAVVRTGRAETYAPGKDTGRYWDAGASEVHWAVVTDGQVEAGFRAALARVRSPGVVVEGNSFLRFAEADFAVLVARADVLKIKPTARRALPGASALYLSDAGRGVDASQRALFEEWWRASGLDGAAPGLPVYTRESLPQLVSRIESAHERVRRGAAGGPTPALTS
jgi:molybdopterin-guanine dinucleotide biosynthesis protein